MQQPILLKDFLIFLIKPSYFNDMKATPTKWKIFNCLRLLSWVLLINILYSIALTVAITITKTPDKNIVTDVLKQAPLFALVYGIFLAPIIEETIFRLPLKFKPIYYFFFLGFILFELIDKIANLFTPIKSLNQIGVIALVAILIALVCYFIIRSKPVYSKFDNFYQKHYRWVFYFFCLLFGYFHLNNFENLGTMLIFIPFLTLTQVFAGFTLGYIRMKYGYGWGILTHMLNNSSILPFVLIMSPSDIVKIITAIVLISAFCALCIFSVGTLVIDLISIGTKKNLYFKNEAS